MRRVPEPGMTSQEMALGQDETSQSLVCKRQWSQVWSRVRKGILSKGKHMKKMLDYSSMMSTAKHWSLRVQSRGQQSGGDENEVVGRDRPRRTCFPWEGAQLCLGESLYQYRERNNTVSSVSEIPPTAAWRMIWGDLKAGKEYDHIGRRWGLELEFANKNTREGMG